MENKLERRYGLFTAICMVVGIVIGSGVFFKAQTILQKTEGNMPLGILAWIIGGMIMIFCILAFAAMAQKYEKVNGVVDYAEATVGPRYGYYLGWFMTIIYYPTLTVILAWLTARYTLVFLTSCWPNLPMLIPAAEGGCVIGPECMVLMMVYLVCAYVVNALSPKLAGKFQAATTVIKLIPLGLMAVVGILVGLLGPNHMLVSNFGTASATQGGTASPLLASVCATSFAYEGWVIATTINSELKDAKRNLPRALIIGGIIIIATYICYYIGVAGICQHLRRRSREPAQPFRRNLLCRYHERPDARLLPGRILSGCPRRGPGTPAFRGSGQRDQYAQQLRHPWFAALCVLGDVLYFRKRPGGLGRREDLHRDRI